MHRSKPWIAEEPHIFVSKLINSNMHGAKRTATNLLFDDILVNSVLSSAIILAESILRSSIERFLYPRLIKMYVLNRKWQRDWNGKPPLQDAELSGYGDGVSGGFQKKAWS